MSNDANKSGPGSATTSRSPRSGDLNEADFLRGQAEVARQAISRKLEEMRSSLHDVGDLKAWAKTHPWSSLGVAAGVGLLAAAAVWPKRRQAEPEHAVLLDRILNDEQISSRIKQLAAEEETVEPGRGAGYTILLGLLKTFGPVLQSAVTAALAARVSQPPSENGAEQHDPQTSDDPTS